MRARLAVLAVLATLPFAAVAQVQKLKALEGKPVPAFTMTDTAGAKITSASLKGKVVLLDFWATWCGPCKEASPFMEKFHKTFSGKGLKVIGANTAEYTNAKTAAGKYKKEHKYTYTFTIENDAYSQNIGAMGLPTFVLVDRKGIVRKVWMGFDAKATPKEMEGAISKLLAQ